jgi:hypothetical protein
MNQKGLQLAFFVGLLGLYNYFFWGEKWGLNLFLFDSLLVASLLGLHRAALRSRDTLAILGLTLLAGAMVVVHNSVASKVAHLGSLLVLVGRLHQPQLRQLYLAGAYTAINLAATPLLGAARAANALREHPRLPAPRLGHFLRLGLAPAVAFMVFFVIFRFANPVFGDLTEQAWRGVNAWLADLFAGFSWARAWFLALGAVLVGGSLYAWGTYQLHDAPTGLPEQLARKRPARPGQGTAPNFAPTGLRYEYQAALLLVGSVNGLLLVVNLIDIRFLWWDFDHSDKNLYKMVHEGTYMLILSILLAMGILLYYFRGNLNFYPRNQWLKRMAGLWQAQNVVLATSVALRCYHYIEVHGLAYRRIGVLIFLALVLYGLFTLYQKIAGLRTMRYLLRTNSWAAYLVMIGLALPDWDMLIVRHNLGMGLADEFTLDRAEKTLPIIHESLPSLQLTERQKAQLNDKLERFKARQATYSWVSWNRADNATLRYFGAGERF